MSNAIVGRDEELRVVHAFLDRALGVPRTLVLEGEAGIGKSTLWLAGVEAARELGFRVLVTRPAEAERGLAYAGLGDLFEGVLEQILPALPAPRRRALEVALLLQAGERLIRVRSVSRFEAGWRSWQLRLRSCSLSTTSSGSTRRRRARSRSRFGGWTSGPSSSYSPVESAKVRRRPSSRGLSLPTEWSGCTSAHSASAAFINSFNHVSD